MRHYTVELRVTDGDAPASCRCDAASVSTSEGLTDVGSF